MAAKKPTTFSMRMPEDLNSKIQSYAAENGCTKAEAMSHFAWAGIEMEEKGTAGQVAQAPGEVSSEGGVPSAVLSRIEQRLDALAQQPEATQEQGLAVIPVDLRGVLQTYCVQHDCSEQEALMYYARIGIQMGDAERPATTQEVAELARRIDILAQDNQAKTEQLKQMAEMLVSIRDYTKPDELELEGELAEQEVEDAEDAALTDEERQRIADEHTKRIVSDVMGDYLTRQQAELAQRDAALEAQRVAMEKASQHNPLASWVPVLVAIIVSLIMGLVVILTR